MPTSIILKAAHNYFSTKSARTSIHCKNYAAVRTYSKLQYRSEIVCCSWHAPVWTPVVGQCSKVYYCWITYSLQITLYRVAQEVWRLRESSRALCNVLCMFNRRQTTQYRSSIKPSLRNLCCTGKAMCYIFWVFVCSLRYPSCSALAPFYRDADKSLARPGRKQATATKLAIYSTYSPRSSIHFLARCSDICKPIKKTLRKAVRPTGSPSQQWLMLRTYQHPCIF